MSIFPEYLEIMPALPVLREGLLVWSPRRGGRRCLSSSQGSPFPHQSLTKVGRGPDRSHRMWQRQEARVCMAGAVQLSTIQGRGHAQCSRNKRAAGTRTKINEHSVTGGRAEAERGLRRAEPDEGVTSALEGGESS